MSLINESDISASSLLNCDVVTDDQTAASSTTNNTSLSTACDTASKDAMPISPTLSLLNTTDGLSCDTSSSGPTAAAAADVIITDEATSPAVPDPPVDDVSLMLQEILSLDLNMEFVTRYQAKPKSMYTFLCAQVFRRDEYASHFRNLHTEILSNLNGWLEQRCPLANQGCTYSFR